MNLAPVPRLLDNRGYLSEFNPHIPPASLVLLFLFSLKVFLVVGSTKIRHLCLVQLALRSLAQKHSQCNGWLAEQQRSPNFVATSELMTQQAKDMTEHVKAEELMAVKSYGKLNFPAAK